MRNLAIKIPPLRKANSALFHYRANSMALEQELP